MLRKIKEKRIVEAHTAPPPTRQSAQFPKGVDGRKERQKREKEREKEREREREREREKSSFSNSKKKTSSQSPHITRWRHNLFSHYALA